MPCKVFEVEPGFSFALRASCFDILRAVKSSAINQVPAIVITAQIKFSCHLTSLLVLCLLESSTDGYVTVSYSRNSCNHHLTSLCSKPPEFWGVNSEFSIFSSLPTAKWRFDFRRVDIDFRWVEIRFITGQIHFQPVVFKFVVLLYRFL